MSAFSKWAKGQSQDDEELDDGELESDEELQDEEEPEIDPEEIAGRLWRGELTESEINDMEGELLTAVVAAAEELEPELWEGILSLSQASADEDFDALKKAYTKMMEADQHDESMPAFDHEQCTLLLAAIFDRIGKGTKLDDEDGQRVLAKMLREIRSNAPVGEDEEDEELADDEDEADDEAADDALLAEFDGA